MDKPQNDLELWLADLDEMEREAKAHLEAVRCVRAWVAAKRGLSSPPRQPAIVEPRAHANPEDVAQPPAAATALEAQVSRIDALRAVFKANPSKPYSLAMLWEELRSHGSDVPPEPMMLHSSIRDLRQRGFIRVHAKGAGKRPSLYIYAGAETGAALNGSLINENQTAQA